MEDASVASPVAPSPGAGAAMGSLIPAASQTVVAPPATPPVAAAPQAKMSSALVPTPATGTPAAGGTVTGQHNGVVDTNTSNRVNGNNALDPYNSGYAGGYGAGYGGMYGGMDPYGYGGMYGMGGLGMGGLGMMGLGGMGMMGMGMFGMTPEAQRSQMMMFMISRMVELWGMFSQVVQAAFVSIIQFADNYLGISQRMGALEDEAINNEEQYMLREYETQKALQGLPHEDSTVVRFRRRARPQKTSLVRRIFWSVLRHTILLCVAYYTTRRLVRWWRARQSDKLLMEAAASMAGSGNFYNSK